MILLILLVLEMMILKSLRRLYTSLLVALEISKFQVYVVIQESDSDSITFIVNMIKDKTERSLAVKKWQGAVLVVEENLISYFYLPKNGINVEKFLEYK
ncbi:MULTISPECIES: hypothetical protein [Streptococcus]|uniref:Uncharacterized protein n=1 Tax=Streptococcus caledonicus TaxID=2614158 RepID=A0ABW0UBJ4_9STRE|nr:hypothetical protein [Streptococcus sp. S784/96/1]